MIAGIFRKNDGYARDVATMAVGTIASQGMTLLAMPILSRLYFPEDFGALAVFMAVSGIAATALTLRYETAILLPKKEEEAGALFKISICSALALGAFAFAASWVLPSLFGTAAALFTVSPASVPGSFAVGGASPSPGIVSKSDTIGSAQVLHPRLTCLRQEWSESFPNLPQKIKPHPQLHKPAEPYRPAGTGRQAVPPHGAG